MIEQETKHLVEVGDGLSWDEKGGENCDQASKRREQVEPLDSEFRCRCLEFPGGAHYGFRCSW